MLWSRRRRCCYYFKWRFLSHASQIYVPLEDISTITLSTNSIPFPLEKKNKLNFSVVALGHVVYMSLMWRKKERKNSLGISCWKSVCSIIEMWKMDFFGGGVGRALEECFWTALPCCTGLTFGWHDHGAGRSLTRIWYIRHSSWACKPTLWIQILLKLVYEEMIFLSPEA